MGGGRLGSEDEGKGGIVGGEFRKALLGTVLLTVSLVMAGCAAGEPREEGTVDRETFEEFWTQYAVALTLSDVEGMLRWFAEDARLTEPGRQPLVGREEIREYMEAVLADYEVPEVSIWPEEVNVHDHRAYELGTFREMLQSRESGDAMHYRGAYVAFWERDDEEWRVTRLLLTPLPPEEERR